jgi:hypothetical protein
VSGALNATALRSGKPELHSAARYRKRAGFTEAEEKTRGEEGTETYCRAGHHGCDGPPAHNSGEYFLRTQAITQPTRRNLAYRIGPGECAEHEGHACFAKTEGLGDFRLRYRDVATVHVADQVHQTD